MRHIHTLLSFALLASLLACSGAKKSQEAVRYRFGHILDIAYTPDTAKRCTGWFTDQGSWMGFTLPETNNWVNGFCGPFSIDHRNWMARSATKVCFNAMPAEVFASDSTNYFPGELSLSAHSASGRITQKLLFTNATTALLRVKSGTPKELLFCGDDWAKGTTFAIDQNTVTATHPSGEIISIGFAPDAKVSCTANNYQAVCSGEKEVWVTLSFLYNEKEKVSGRQKAAAILAQPDSFIVAHNERWEGYLNKVLRKDLPAAYDRIAVKAVVTLLSNWRTNRGGLLHEGVVPSHAVGYFVGFWAWDSWRFSVALARFAPELAKNNLRAMFDYQQPDGMIIDCIYTNPEENNARDSKPPLAVWAVDEIFTHTQDTAFVREMYPQLLAYHRWWYAKRDHNHNGICEFGSTDGTLEAAAWESGMDNAIRFDNAKMLKNDSNNAWSFDQESVDLNAYLAQEYKLLKKLAAVIGQPFAEKDYTTDVARYFFDKEMGFFFDRRLSDSSFVRDEGCEAYIPFWTGIATAQQMDKSLKLFTDTAKFATYIPFPTVAADHPKFMPKGYWRGPIWLDQTYFAIKGLRNYGHHSLADKCTKQVFDRLQGLKEGAPIHENYGTHTGERLKAPHFSWSSVHLLLLYEELTTEDTE
ncbi:MAG: trehalase family glycosidase [Bacteroides sp.]